MIIELLKKYYKTIILIIVFTTIQAIANLTLPDYMSNIVTNGIAKNDMNYVIITGLKMIGITLLTSGIAVLVSYLTARFGASVARFLRHKVFKKVTNMDQPDYKNFQTSSLITRTTNDIDKIQMAATMIFRMVTLALIMGIGGTLKAVVKSQGMSSLATIVIIGVGAILLLLVLMYIFVIPKFNKIQALVDKINSKTRESLNGILVVRAFNQEKTEEKKYGIINEEYSKIELFLARSMALLNPYITLVMNGVSIAIVWAVSKQATDVAAIGNMLAFMQYAIQIISSFLMLSMMFVFIPRSKVSYDRINEVLKVKDKEKKDNNKINLKGHIEFKNVSFKYPDADEYILENISFTAKPGSVTAIIGSTGSGKSTIAGLIPKLYEINDGKILIDNENINNIDEINLRDQIGYVPQKAILFKGTVKSNLLIGDIKRSEKELIEALQDAELSKFKLDKEISQKGSNLSGGQRQRVCIARALVKKPNILVFDDSFSALDYRTDAKIRKTLKNKYKDTTVIIVAQRIGTILNADNIIVLDQGRIESQGTHEQLQKSSKIYKEIILSQYGKEQI